MKLCLHHRLSLVLFIGLSVLLSLEAIQLFSHGLYRSPDIALFDQAVWNTVKGDWFGCSIQGFPFLGEHYALSLLLFTPFYFLYPWTGWLLIVQAIALASIGYAVFLIAVRNGLSEKWALSLQIIVSIQPALHAVNRSNFHMNSIAAGFLIWALHFWEREKYIWTVLFFWLMLASEEDFAVTGVGIGLMLLIEVVTENHQSSSQRAEEKQWKRFLLGSLMVIASLAWFLLVVQLAIPQYEPYPLYHQKLIKERYGFESYKLSGQLQEVVTNPEFLGRLVQRERLQFVFELLAGTFFLSLLWPVGLVALAINLIPNLLSQHVAQYSTAFYYQSLALAILAYAAIKGASVLQAFIHTRKAVSALDNWLPIGAVLVAIGFSASQILPMQMEFYDLMQRRELPSKLAQVKQHILPDDSVASSLNIASHFCQRKHYTVFPNTQGAKWVVIDTEMVLNPEAFETQLFKSGAYRLVFKALPLCLFEHVE